MQVACFIKILNKQESVVQERFYGKIIGEYI